MTIPKFSSVAFTVPVGKQPSAQVIDTMSQDLGNTGTGPGLGPLAAMGWGASIGDTTILSSDGLTVRRMLTFATPASGYTTASALKSCLRNLYTRQLEAFCGTKVTGLEPVTFDDPGTLIGALGVPFAWWTSAAFGSGALGFANPWVSNGLAPVTLNPPAPGDEFALGAADALLNDATPAVSVGAPHVMQNAVAFAAIAQPWSVAVIGHPATAAGAGNWTGGDGGSCDIIRDGANVTFTTDGGGTVLVGPAQDGNPHLIIGTADGLDSALTVDLATFSGAAGAGTPTVLSALAANGGGNPLAASDVDIILLLNGGGTLAAVQFDLYAYAQGRYGVNYW